MTAGRTADPESDEPSQRPSPASGSLRPYQQTELDFLRTHPRSANYSEAGLGKTRPLLLAAEGDTLVIAPAGVRDTEVWQTEAERIGVPAPTVISYHQAIKREFLGQFKPDTLILDESHRVKSRKTTWVDPIYQLTQRTQRVHHATGTPMPNDAQELWSQLRMLRPQTREMRYYWPWIQTWFSPEPTHYDQYAYGSSLIGCKCREPDDLDGSCEHWRQFYAANIGGYAIRHLRDQVLTDLPPLSGADTPLWTPMTPKQRTLYQQLKKALVASLPGEDIAFEALTDSHQFAMLMQLSCGLSVLDPDLDPKHKDSGKLAYLREVLPDRKRPTVAAVWYRNTAKAMQQVCDELKLSHAAIGGATSKTNRLKAVKQFRAGDIDVLIGSIGVIKEGIDGLQYASDETILLERSWIPGDNEQLIRRLHRMGQQWPVTARQLVTPDTVDQSQWEALRLKAGRIAQVLTPLEVANLL